MVKQHCRNCRKETKWKESHSLQNEKVTLIGGMYRSVRMLLSLGADLRGHTCHRSGPIEMVKCIKCIECGRSITS